MKQDIKAHAPEAKEGGSLLGRLFGRGGHETPGPNAELGSKMKTTLDLPDIQGFILRGYRMPIVRHFLLTVGVPGEARKLLGRIVSGDESDAPQITTAEDWHVGFAPGPGDNPADVPRHKPDYCLNVAITWPGMIALEIKDRVPTIRRLWEGKRSRHGDAACHKPGGADDLQRTAICAVCPRECLSRDLADRRNGVDGDGGW